MKYWFLFFSCIIFAQQPNLYPVKKGEKWGYYDGIKKIVITPQYDFAEPFSDYRIYDPSSRKYNKVRSATVVINGKKKCILPDSSEINCSKLSNDASEDSGINAYDISQQQYEVQQKAIENENRELINQIPLEIRSKYDKINRFNQSLPLFLVVKNGKSGIIENNGNVVLPLVNDFVEGHVYETATAGKYDLYFVGVNLKPVPDKYYLRDGKFLIESYSPFSTASDSGSFIKVSDKNKKIKIYNLTYKKYINDKTYDKTPGLFSNGMMLVERNGQQFYIDETGKEFKSK